MPDAHSLIDSFYEQAKDPRLDSRKFPYSVVEEILQEWRSKQLFNEIKAIGHSFLQQPIYQLKWGQGETKIMMWSQMHGNESTATRALFDWFNLLELIQENHPELYQNWYNQVSITIIPVVNPDGMNAYTRENYLGIDINRDARAKQSDEAKVLWNAFESCKPDLAFNLHDQRNFYNVANTKEPATISFLAPAYNHAKEVNTNRLKAMQWITHFDGILKKKHLPQGSALYNDTFYPTSFGDNFQAAGAATVLIESGAARNDPNRLKARKLNALIYVETLHAISEGKSLDSAEKEYFNIPMNDEKMFDVKVDNVMHQGKLVSMGINYQPSDCAPEYETAIVEKIGDLDNFSGLQEYDAENTEIEWASLQEYSGERLQENVIQLVEKPLTEPAHKKLSLRFSWQNNKAFLNRIATFNTKNGLRLRNGYSLP